MGRKLCVNMLPALFKIHKTYCVHGSQTTRVFMVFLDRKVEDKLALIAAFCSVISSILCTSIMMFFRYFPVTVSEQCLEKDNQERSLFCYLKNGSNPIKLYPVDCAEYSVSELQKLQFECYSVNILGIGLALAAALALAKVARVIVTIFVIVSAEVYEKTTKYSHKLERCCRKGKQIVDIIYIASCLIVLCIVVVVTVSISAHLLSATSYAKPSTLNQLTGPNYLFYVALPLLMCFPMAYIIVKLEDHCNHGEYVSFTADHRPPDASVIGRESLASISEEQQTESVTAEQEPCDSNILVDSELAVTERQQDASVTFEQEMEENDNRAVEDATEP